ncbi:MAG TPA: deoxyguanosinetriphosphate triphosphohydrolase [Candidatus Copromorpha excrementigallinarum]|uniref:Deoxyguanosinetriphosphate triphosphohydrolase-like protein n=1 Tax=Candidatus Allocopromorpha excrementigallinarum TaxID=2840742 RepID=A0A9D1L6W4_9FIRM|nr:deoxyguanosinetriphosphate triphosphohydrolase [Candidatus Copromorpha excrementigallinarum]
MLIREELEKREFLFLSEYAVKASESKGRLMPEEKCTVRTDFQRDRDRIVHSKAFRRLMHKTQVFLAPEDDHFRTRLTHTIEVSQIARTIARGAALNEDLAEAIAMGHDLGHTPFGHSGETILNEIYPGGFKHNVQSLRVVDVLESSASLRRGMNLTYEVRDGILNHTGNVTPKTLEGQVVKISDRIAYINHDIDDAIRSGVITSKDLPEESIKVLGDTHKKRIDTLVKDMIENTAGSSRASLSEEKAEAMDELRTYMFKNVYHSENVKKAEDMDKVRIIITSLYDYFLEHPEKLPKDGPAEEEGNTAELVKDHIAGMTDRYAINLYNELFVAKGWR